MGSQVGWAPFGREVGIDGETIRQFAKATDGRGAQPETLTALRRYFSPASPSELQIKAQQALSLIEQGRALLSEVVRQLPADAETAETIARMDDPMPSARPDAAPAKRRRGGVG